MSTATETDNTDDDLQPQTDRGWENRRTILAALAPRPTSRPARHGTGSEPPTTTDAETAPQSGIFTQFQRVAGRGARRGINALNKRVPPHRRVRTAATTAVVLFVLVVALSVVRMLAADNSSTTTTAATHHAAPPPPSPSPVATETILTGIKATDFCPKDHGEQYSPIANAFDNNLQTAWICTRAKNKDGQLIVVDFGRTVTLTQALIDGGFDAHIPDTPGGVDQWPKHRIVTKLEIYYPKELGRQKDVIDTGGARDFRGIPGGIKDPPRLSKLLLRVAETVDPPQSSDSPTETNTTSPTNDTTTTVAISKIQFLGTSS